jgi:hypothetical protein
MSPACPIPKLVANKLNNKILLCLTGNIRIMFFSSVTQRDALHKEIKIVPFTLIILTKPQLRSLLRSPVIFSPLTSPARCSSPLQAHVQLSVHTHYNKSFLTSLHTLSILYRNSLFLIACCLYRFHIG